MTGEVAGWKSLADGLLASFGDVVFDATVSIVTGHGAYDPSKGIRTPTTDDIATRGVWAQKKYRLFKRDLWQEGDNVALVRGSDFDEQPKIGAVLVVDAVKYNVIGVTDPAGQGIVFYLHVRSKS